MAQRKRKAEAEQEQQAAASSDQSAHSGTTAVTLTEVEKKRAISRKSSQRHRLKEKFALEDAQEKKDELTEKNRMIKAENRALREQIRIIKLFKTSGNIPRGKLPAMTMQALMAPSTKAAPAAAAAAPTLAASSNGSRFSSAVTQVSNFASLQAASAAPSVSSGQHSKDRSVRLGSPRQPWPSSRLGNAIQVEQGDGRVSPGSSVTSAGIPAGHVNRQRLENLLQSALRLRQKAAGSLLYSSASSTASIGDSSATSAHNARQQLESMLQDASQGRRPGAGAFGSASSVNSTGVQNDKQRLERALQDMILGRTLGNGGLASIRPTNDSFTNALSIEEVLKSRDPQMMQLLESKLQAMLQSNQDTGSGGISIQALAGILQKKPQNEPCPQRLDLEIMLQGMLQSNNGARQQAPQVIGNASAVSLQDLAKALEQGSCQPQVQTMWDNQRPRQPSTAASQLETMLLQESLRRRQGSTGNPSQEVQQQAMRFLPTVTQRGSLGQQGMAPAAAQMPRVPVSQANNLSANDRAVIDILMQRQQRHTVGNVNYGGLPSNKRSRLG